MKTIRMQIDDELLAAVDRMSQQMNTTRSAFITEALRLVLQQPTIAELERRHAEGYRQHPVARDEVEEWTMEQVWDSP